MKFWVMTNSVYEVKKDIEFDHQILITSSSRSQDIPEIHCLQRISFQRQSRNIIPSTTAVAGAGREK